MADMDLTAFETMMVNMGIRTPSSRFAAFGGATLAGIYFMKPDMFFKTDGNPRPWSVAYPDPEGTMVPWWMAGVLAGLVGMTIF